MRSHGQLLARPRLTLISGEPDPDLERMLRTIAHSARVDGAAALVAVLESLVERPRDAPPPAHPGARSLDLFGHATASGHLRLGDWVIDASQASVVAVFRGLAERQVLARLGICAVRLLACHTGTSDAARATLATLAELLGVEVHGTTGLLYDAHHDADGFLAAWEFLLISSAQLAARPTAPAPTERPLELAALPAAHLAPHRAIWPLRIATVEATDALLALVGRDAGAWLPGPAQPTCGLALPASAPGTYHLADVLFEGLFLQFYPHGHAAPGVAYPVADPVALGRIVDALPEAPLAR